MKNKFTKKRKAGVVASIGLLIPAFSLAATCTTAKDIPSLFDYARCVLSDAVIPFIIGLAVLLFLIGVLRYVSAGDNEEKREGGRNLMIFGIIALFVMVCVWGFVKLLATTFGFDYSLPTLPPSSQGSNTGSTNTSGSLSV